MINLTMMFTAKSEFNNSLKRMCFPSFSMQKKFHLTINFFLLSNYDEPIKR